jgi:hypothetical protein
MRIIVALTVATFTGLAAPARSQTIDSQDEAWAIAGRQSITPAEWTLVDYDAEAAAFVKKLPAGPFRSESWVAFIFADSLTATLSYLHADCGTSEFWSSQSSTRDWNGTFLRSSGSTVRERAVPGSVGEAMLESLCPPVIVPGPPRG